MRVEATKQAASGHAGPGLSDRAPKDSVNHVSESRALVVTEPSAVAESYMPRRQAAFLAHLIATKEQAPQTRERRRAEPGVAIAAYRKAATLA